MFLLLVFCFFLVLGGGFAKKGSSHVKSTYYVLPVVVVSLLTSISYIVVEKGKSTFASHQYIQEKAEIEYRKKEYTLSQELLLQAIKTAPLRARPLRIYNQIPQQNMGKYTEAVIDRAPNDVHSYISICSNTMRQKKN